MLYHAGDSCHPHNIQINKVIGEYEKWVFYFMEKTIQVFLPTQYIVKMINIIYSLHIYIPAKKQIKMLIYDWEKNLAAVFFGGKVLLLSFCVIFFCDFWLFLLISICLYNQGKSKYVTYIYENYNFVQTVWVLNIVDNLAN